LSFGEDRANRRAIFSQKIGLPRALTYFAGLGFAAEGARDFFA
jgi:hypothetical protein